jgi:hypothetical protein
LCSFIVFNAIINISGKKGNKINRKTKINPNKGKEQSFGLTGAELWVDKLELQLVLLINHD